jgi:hypothetical protein
MPDGARVRTVRHHFRNYGGDTPRNPGRFRCPERLPDH